MKNQSPSLLCVLSYLLGSSLAPLFGQEVASELGRGRIELASALGQLTRGFRSNLPGPLALGRERMEQLFFRLSARTLSDQERNISTLAVTPDGKELVAGGCEDFLRSWPLAGEDAFHKDRVTPAALAQALPFFLPALQARTWEEFRASVREGLRFFR